MSPVPPDAFVNRELSWLEFNRAGARRGPGPDACRCSSASSSWPSSARTSTSSSWCGWPSSSGASGRATPSAGAGRADPGPDAGRDLRAGPRAGRGAAPVLPRGDPAAAGRRRRPASSGPKEVTAEQARFLEDYFRRTLLPVVTPLAIDPGHPFPHLANRSLCLIVSLRPVAPSRPAARRPGGDAHSRPGRAPLRAAARAARPVRVHAARGRDPPPAPQLYHGYEILSATPSGSPATPRSRSRRRTAADLLTEHRGRACASAAWATRSGCSTMPTCRPPVLAMLVDELELGPDDLYAGEGFTAFSDLFQLYAAVDLPRLKDRAAAAAPGAGLRGRGRRLERDPRAATCSSITRTSRSTPSPAS